MNLEDMIIIMSIGYDGRGRAVQIYSTPGLKDLFG